MHIALAVTVIGVLRQHFAELFELAFAPELDHAFIHLMVKLAGIAVHALFCALIVNETVRERSAGENGHGTVVLFNGFENGLTQFAAVFKGVNGAKR